MSATIQSTTSNHSSPSKNSTLQKLCAPAVIYMVFSLVQIIIDIFKGLYNQAFFKFIVMIIFTFLLNGLCAGGLGVISWMLVFVPFILMSLITTILLFVFGLDPSTGKLSINGSSNTQKTTTKYVYIDPRQRSVYEDEEYNPNDYYSGTPAEINHYNNTIPSSGKNKQLVGTDCESKNMKSCGSTGPDVCYPVDKVCPGVGSAQTGAGVGAPNASQTTTSKVSTSQKTVPGKWTDSNPLDSSYPTSVKSEVSKGLYGSNNPNDPLAPIPKMPNGPRTAAGMALTRPKYKRLGKKTSNNNSEMDAPPPPGTTSIEKFMENMTVSLGF